MDTPGKGDSGRVASALGKGDGNVDGSEVGEEVGVDDDGDVETKSPPIDRCEEQRPLRACAGA